MMNNQDELYALWQGVNLLHSQNIKPATVVGDSSLVIGHMDLGNSPIDTWLDRLCKRIRDKTCKDIQELYFLHILRQLNITVDRKANEACGKQPGPLTLDDEGTSNHISYLEQYFPYVFYGWLENFRLAGVFIIQGSSYTIMCEPM